MPIWNQLLMISFHVLGKLEVHVAGEPDLASLKIVVFVGTWLFWVPDVAVLILITNKLNSLLIRTFTPLPLPLAL